MPDILSHFHKIWILSDFHQVLNNNCHGIPSSGSCADTCGHMDRHAKGNRCFTWLCMHLKVKCKVPTASHVTWGLYYTCLNQNRIIVSAQAQYHVSPQCEEKLWKRNTHTHMNRHDCQHCMLILCTLSRECTDKQEQRKPPYWSNDDVKFNILTAMTTKITSSGMYHCVIG